MTARTTLRRNLWKKCEFVKDYGNERIVELGNVNGKVGDVADEYIMGNWDYRS